MHCLCVGELEGRLHGAQQWRWLPAAGHPCTSCTPLLRPPDLPTTPCPADVVAVQWLLFEQGYAALLRDALAALSRWPAGASAAGRLSWHAIDNRRCGGFVRCAAAQTAAVTVGRWEACCVNTHCSVRSDACCTLNADACVTRCRRERLVAATSLALLLAGCPHEAAAALEALVAASGQQQARVVRVAAAVMVDAVDGGAAAAVAEANAQLWGCGLTPLLRDAMACAARQGWADAAAKVSRQALDQGHSRMVADVAAALIVEGAVQEAAELAAQLAMAANFSSAAIQASQVRGRVQCGSTQWLAAQGVQHASSDCCSFKHQGPHSQVKGTTCAAHIHPSVPNRPLARP